MKKLLYIFSFMLAAGSVSAQTIDLDAMPKPAPTPNINIDQPKTFKLANGLTVLVVENNKLPRASANLTIDRPPVYEGEKAGYISLMGDLLGDGTTTVSKDEFNKRIDFLGARVSYFSSGAYARSLSKYFPEILALMADGAINPKFTQEELDKAKERTIEGLKSEEKSAEAINARVFAAVKYGKNTARGEFETNESIQRVQLNDIQNAYKNFYTPNNAYLVIVGDVKFEEVKKLVEKNFSSWKKGTYVFPPLAKAPMLAKTEVDIVNVPNAVQSIVSVGNLTDLKMNNPQYFAALASNYILGGSADARLFMNLREKNGYTYGAYSSLSTNKYSPNFDADASVRTAVTKGAVKEFLKEINGISSITTEELNNAKQKLKGSFIMSLERPETIAMFALNQQTENLPKDFYNNYLKSIDALTQTSVQNAAKSYITPNALRIFVTGKATEIADSLESLGYPVKYYDAYANLVSKPEAPKVDANVSVATIGEKYINAIGGKAAVEKIKSISMKADATIQGMQIEMENKQMEGGAQSVEMKMNGNSLQKIVFDGAKGYMQAQGQTIPLPEEMIETFAGNKELFPELNFTTSKDYTLAGIENINGEDAYAVKGKIKTLYYSVKTGLKIAEMQTQTVQGKEMQIPTYFSDYKEVEGVKMPFILKQNMMGTDVTFNVKSYEINKVSAEDFK